MIGAGASGTLAVIHLLRQAAAGRVPLRVALIDRHGRHGLGQAYSTTHPAHLLNAPAEAMSALTGDPGHLTRWAAQAGLRHDGFLPRSAYGRYLRELLEESEHAALPAARVSHLTSDVVAIRRSGRGRALRLYLAADGRVDADAVVLATGNLPPVPPCPLPGNDRYVADPWEPGALRAAADGSPVIVLGTGLSMLDVAIAVTDADPRTVVYAVSRHALLPRAHRWPRPPAAPDRPVIRSTSAPLRLAALTREVRASVAQYAGDWQDIVDALPAGWSTAPGPAAISPPPPTRCSATCSTRAWPGRTRCGWAWTPTRAARCATRPTGQRATSSPSARRCADAGTRPRPSPRSATRPPHWPAS